GRVVQRSMEALSDMGYYLSQAVVDAAGLGVPQRRRRLLVLASRSEAPDASRIELDYRRNRRGIAWAIEDLVGREPTSIFDQAAKSAPDTVRRIDYLFDN